LAAGSAMRSFIVFEPTSITAYREAMGVCHGALAGAAAAAADRGVVTAASGAALRGGGSAGAELAAHGESRDQARGRRRAAVRTGETVGARVAAEGLEFSPAGIATKIENRHGRTLSSSAILRHQFITLAAFRTTITAIHSFRGYAGITRQAQTLNSGILLTGSSARIVRRFADLSSAQW